MDVSQERFDAVLQRLEVRQLVVSAQAEKGDLALYRLLANLYVIPLESSFMVKMQAFFSFYIFEMTAVDSGEECFSKRELHRNGAACATSGKKGKVILCRDSCMYRK